MEARLDVDLVAAGDRSIAEAFRSQHGRLRNFIRKRVADPSEAEDILQDVFRDLVESARLPTPIEQVGAWLFRVARNRIVDRFRRSRHEPAALPDDLATTIEDALPSPDGGPEAAYARRVLLEELEAALDELPAEQRAVFVAHELEGRSFNEIAAASGVGLNTLLARKRYAVLYLRRRLQAIHDEFGEP
jgi:RNA polymerase sigma factor (sigma-70 family)